MSNGKLMGISLISFFAAIAGIVVSFLLIREDVTSTAHTLFEYFPMKFGVTPSSTWSGAIILGIFTSILQVVAASVAFNKQFSTSNRVLAFLTFVFACYFDNWTDVVFRSGNLTGDVKIATITTLAFYTFGSELTQGLSWLVFAHNWRSAISDIMWGWAKVQAGFNSISVEWNNFQRAAINKENKDRGVVESNKSTTGITSHKISYPNKNVYNVPKKVAVTGTPTYHPTNTNKKPVYTEPTYPIGTNQKPIPHAQPKPYPRESTYLKMIEEGEEGN